MDTSTQDYALLAQKCYLQLQAGVDEFTAADGQKFKVIEVSPPNGSGYFGAIFQNETTGELVVAHRGTEADSLDGILHDAIEADGQMALGLINQQVNDANHLVERALELAKTSSPTGGPVSVTVTGHSLGGSLAQITASEYGLYGETFNAYGAAGIQGTPAGGNQVMNYVRATDMVAAAGEHFGEVIAYANASDRQLSLSGSFDLTMITSELSLDVTHGIAQFVDDPAISGNESLLTDTNHSIYEDDQTIYDAYRAQIRAAALDVRYLLPLVGAAEPLVGALYGYLTASYLKNEIVHAVMGLGENDSLTGGDGRNFIRGGLGADLISGGGTADLLFGDRGNDVLRGLAGDDGLYGADDDDYLDGGAGSDRLEGGAGHDRYDFSIADFEATPGSVDTILDSDGDGQIEINAVVLSVGQRIDETTWRSLDGRFLISADLSQPVQVMRIKDTQTGATVLVNDWANGALGIQLGGAVPAPQGQLLTSGQDLFGEAGSNAGADSVLGAGGNDGLEGGFGNDVLDGGDGADLVLGGPGNDHLYGGDGNDLISDNAGIFDLRDLNQQEQQAQDDAVVQLGSAVLARGSDWYIYRADGAAATGDATIDKDYLLVGIPNGSQSPDPNVTPGGDDIIDAGAGSDIVFGGEGDDQIQGGTGNDAIDGGHDNDVIYGGDGNDRIDGDTELDNPAPVSATANINGNDLIDGGAGADTIRGGGGDDVIFGGTENDILIGRGRDTPADAGDTDSDYMDGGAGDDQLAGNDGDDVLIGGDGSDVIRGDDAMAGTNQGSDHLDGGAGQDYLYGDGGGDVLLGGDDADQLVGDNTDIDGSLHGADLIDGGAGNDVVFGLGGADTIFGGDGADQILGDADTALLAAQFHGADAIYGEGGNDVIWGNGGDDTLDGGADDDQISGGDGADKLSGGTGTDRLFGDAGNDKIEGGDGNDVAQGGDGNDTMSGGTGIDAMDGGAGDDVLDGGDGNDQLHGGEGADRLVAATGNDLLWGDAGADTLLGGAGNNQLHGGDGDDNLAGDAGNDTLWGDAGADTLDGGAGDDQLNGGAGDDVIYASEGRDRLNGGAGHDTYILSPGDANGSYADTVTLNESDDALSDVVVLRQVAPTQVALTVDDGNLGIRLDTGDSFVLSGFQSGDEIRFDDGTVWDYQYVSGHVAQAHAGDPVPVIYGMDGDDLLTGTEGDDRIYAGLGADVVDGLGGDDVISAKGQGSIVRGGRGDDSVSGSVYTFIYEAGDGRDEVTTSPTGGGMLTIRFGEGISQSDLEFKLGGIVLPDGGEVVFSIWSGSFRDGQANDSRMRTQIEFADGTTISSTELIALSMLGTPDAQNIEGSMLSDVINGGDGDDEIVGYEGNDRLDGGLGNDALAGGSGNDTFVFGRDFGQDVINGYIHFDKDIASQTETAEFAYRLDEMDVWWEGDDLVVATKDGQNRVTIFGQTVDSFVFLDTTKRWQDFKDAPHRYDTGQVFHAREGLYPLMGLIGSGDDVLYGTDKDEGLNGGAGDDVLYGLAGNDTLHGGQDGLTHDTSMAPGNDLLVGGTGDDKLWGETGSDTYVFANGDGADQIYEDRHDPASIDVIRFVDATPDSVWFTSDGGFAIHYGNGDSIAVNLQFDSEGAPLGIEEIRFADGTVWGIEEIKARAIAGDDTDQVLPGYSSADFIDGLKGNDHIEGLGGDDQLSGGDGDDWVEGNEGDDRLDGGAGTDQLYGDEGADTFVFGRGYGHDVVNDYAMDQEGNHDTLEFIGDVGYDQLWFRRVNSWDIECSIIGTDDSVIISQQYLGPYVATITANGGAMTLDTSKIDQLIAAMAGLSPPPAGQTELSESERAQLAAAFAAAWAGEVPDPVDPDQVLTGTSGADVISGQDGNDRLYGKDGDDTLSGGAGNDRLNGGTGADAMSGGAGDDTYYVDASGDVVTEAADEGTDVVVSTMAYALGDNVENLTLSGDAGIDGTGNALANRLSGNAADNILDGRAGNDRLYGQAGDDTLAGGEGDDTLVGGEGADAMAGGAGNDVYYADAAGDTATEAADEGIDRVSSTVDFTLGANVENLTLGGTDAIDGTGNDLANTLSANGAANVLDGHAGDDRLYGQDGDDTLSGGDGDDTLNGGAGADAMSGGGGDDTFYVDDAGDMVVEVSGEGTDAVVSTVAFALGTDIENLTLSGEAAIDGTGNALANKLTGNDAANALDGQGGDDRLYGKDGDDALFGGDGNDILTGGAGTDAMTGGVGDDTYYVDDGGDTAIEAAGEGSDRVSSTISFALGANIENLSLTGTAAIDGTGNELANTLAANEAANVLDGGAGNDRLYGKEGGDTYLFARGTGSDTVIEADAELDDTDVARFTSGIAFDQLWFAKSGNNLVVSIIGTSDRMVVANWFLGQQYQVEQFVTDDGDRVLQASDVQSLVDAMSQMQAPAPGQTTLSAGQHAALDAVLDAAWSGGGTQPQGLQSQGTFASLAYLENDAWVADGNEGIRVGEPDPTSHSGKPTLPGDPADAQGRTWQGAGLDIGGTGDGLAHLRQQLDRLVQAMAAHPLHERSVDGLQHDTMLEVRNLLAGTAQPKVLEDMPLR